MPPKAKFTKDEIISAALDLVRESGVDALTARTLGAKLNSSPRPIFTVFQSMEEVKNAVRSAAEAWYGKYVQAGLTEKPAFKGVGTAYIRFAAEEPQLFRLLFMTDYESSDLNTVLPTIDQNYSLILRSVENSYSLSPLDAEWLYRHLWLYTHGIAALIATHVCQFSNEEIGRLLSDVCSALLQKKKGEFQ